MRGLIAALRETYCGTLGVEYTDIPDKTRRDWLQQQMERDHNRPRLENAERIRILEWLLAADAFEQFLQVKYVGQKRFSLEGSATLIPMLETLIDEAADLRVEQIVLGMPHRGRLNVLANVLGKPLERLFSEFESHVRPEAVSGHGDVKYHLGFSSRRESRAGRTVHLNLHYNPSHLEFVNPVVLGSVRARQALMSDTERAHGWPILVHGDASFTGEGVVAETLSLAELPSYRVGGTVHLIVNNQIGFTTSPAEGRPTRYATDLARVVEAPVFHVNGDDPEAAVHAMRLAARYRAEFGARRIRGPRVLSQARSQRAGRPDIHAAGHVQEDRRARAGVAAIRRAIGPGGRARRSAARVAGGRDRRAPERGAPPGAQRSADGRRRSASAARGRGSTGRARIGAPARPFRARRSSR